MKYAIPYVFAFVERINSIKVNDSLYIERGEKGKLGLAEVHTIYITENGNKNKLFILLYHEEKIDLAILERTYWIFWNVYKNIFVIS